METVHKINTCSCCGKCCLKGGPAFHLEDKSLIDKGSIPATDLFTIREGEPVQDNVRGIPIRAESDIIKLKGIGASWACLYYDHNQNQCKIYSRRPLECKLLKCWDTRDIERTYSKERLTRKDLLKTSDTIWQLIQEHTTRCNYDTLLQLVEKHHTHPSPSIKRAISESIEYDRSIRELLVENGKMDKDLLDFIFGRPLSKTMKSIFQNAPFEK